MAEEYLTDDEQLEVVKRWTAENGIWLVGGIALGVALLWGYRYYESYKNEQALKAAAQFSAMTDALDKNDQNAARHIADGLIKDYSNTPYADQAQFALARLSIDAGEPAKAVAPLTQVMSHSSDNELQHIARLRLARVLTDQGKADDAIATLGTVPSGAFAGRYHEVRGDAFFAKKSFKEALLEYKEAQVGSDERGADRSVLSLKIAELAALVPATMVPATMVPATNPDLSNKAKP